MRDETTYAGERVPYITPAEPGGPPRPLWYRLSAILEPLRPLFGWAVANERTVAGLALGVGALAAALPILVVRRARRSGG